LEVVEADAGVYSVPVEETVLNNLGFDQVAVDSLLVQDVEKCLEED
jgi:hypothetical protein